MAPLQCTVELVHHGGGVVEQIVEGVAASYVPRLGESAFATQIGLGAGSPIGVRHRRTRAPAWSPSPSDRLGRRLVRTRRRDLPVGRRRRPSPGGRCAAPSRRRTPTVGRRRSTPRQAPASPVCGWRAQLAIRSGSMWPKDLAESMRTTRSSVAEVPGCPEQDLFRASTGRPSTSIRPGLLPESVDTSREQISPGLRGRRSVPCTAAKTGTGLGRCGRRQRRSRAAVTCVKTAPSGSTSCQARRSRRNWSSSLSPTRSATKSPWLTRRNPRTLTSPRIGSSSIIIRPGWPRLAARCRTASADCGQTPVGGCPVGAVWSPTASERPLFLRLGTKPQ